MSSVLGPDEASYNQSLIGVMRWIIKIKHIDINTKVFPLSSCSSMPRQGHLEAVLHIMGDLKVFNPSYPHVDYYNLWECDWIDFFQGTPNTPPPRGKELDSHMFIVGNHAGDNHFRRSITRFMIYMNTSLVY